MNDTPILRADALDDDLQLDTGDERVPIGTRVFYHGGIWVIRNYNDPLNHPDERVVVSAAKYYPDGTGYELWPADLPHKFGLREYAYYFVRRTSFTVIERVANG